MTNPVHLLSVAGLLLAAFLVGAVIGTIARVVYLRLARQPPAAVARPAETKSAGPPLVAAPVIVPLPVAAAPVVPEPADIPVPDFAATLIALAGETPPAAFIAETRARAAAAEPVSPQPELRQMPVLAPLPEIESAPTMQPAHVAGETTSGVHVAAPLHDTPPVVAEVPAETPGRHTAEVILFPTTAAEPAEERPTPLIVGGEAVALVDAYDLVEPEPESVLPVATIDPVQPARQQMQEPVPGLPSEDDFRIVAADALLDPAPQVAEPATDSDTIPIPAIAANAAVGEVASDVLPFPEVVEAAAVAMVATDPVFAASAQEPSAKDVASEFAAALLETDGMAIEPAQEPVALIVAQEPVAVAPATETAPTPAADQPPEEPAPQQPEPAPAPVSLDAPMDEDAAMRAIEGNWSPRRTASRRPVRATGEPEGANQAVAASARAVIAARRTAEAVVAEVAEAKVEAGRPAGLDVPRDGRKDDLTHIIGVLPVIETALNKLGIYHFDQMGALTDDNIGWIEGHLGVPGRISRELWREQARELSAVMKPKRVAEN